jgi:uncharacterized protein (DUF1800 family)
VLNRLTFGPRPGDVERVLDMGIDRWIDEQLRPESIVDAAGGAAQLGCSLWTPTSETRAVVASETATGKMGTRVRAILVRGFGVRVVSRDSARRAGPLGQMFLENGQLLACRIARVEASDRRLLQVMTDFWQNHFSVFGGKVPSRGSIVEWDSVVIRPNALGRFRDLLGAVAHSSAMLEYLDNAVSSASTDYPTLTEYMLARAQGTEPVIGKRPAVRNSTGLNENYARELLELHTLGVDAGYTQADVIAVARAFTGWSHSGVRAGGMIIMAGNRAAVNANARQAAFDAAPAFVFDSARHDAGEKVILGRTLQAGRGMEDGEEVLDMLARHPSTALFIARKLAVRFVSDSPPDALVERAAATYVRTDGDIREVVRTIVTSPEFFSPDVHGVKVKSPLELVLSARRALSAPVDTAAEVIDLLIALGQPPFGRETPEGWPETGAGWMNAGAIMARIDLAVRISRGELPSIPVEAWPSWSTLMGQPFDKQVDGVLETLFAGRSPPELRTALMAARPDAADRDDAENRELALRLLIALALGSAEFQRR